jgi:hypothetical protein
MPGRYSAAIFIAIFFGPASLLVILLLPEIPLQQEEFFKESKKQNFEFIHAN